MIGTLLSNPRYRLLLAIAAALAFGLLAPAAPGWSDVRPTGGQRGDAQQACPAPGNIQHVIYLIKENRTFDNYFGTFPGAEGATAAVDSQGQTVPLQQASDTTFGCDIDHSWQGARNAWDCGLMDKFDTIGFSGRNCDRTQPQPYTNHSLTQFHQADLPNYWAYAKHFTLGDHMFTSEMGPSYPNHLFTVAAQAGGEASGFGAINNPHGGAGTSGGWGCDVSGQLVQTVAFGPPPSTCPFTYNLGSHSSCWNFRVFPDELEANGLDWRYYAPQPGASGYIWSAFNAVRHIRDNPAEWAKVVPYTQFFADLTSGGLKPVSWIVLPGACSEHAPSSVCQGENYTVKIVNALMSSPYWCTSALFVTWDDFGGFYDHLSPPVTAGQDADVNGPGFRAPLLVISPYAKAGFIDKTRYDFSSMLKFAEVTFGLSPLTMRDQNANDMLNAFDFTKVNPRLFLTPRPTCSSTCTTGASALQAPPDSDLDDD
ncbi:MAG TPA: alkaline phosphatase family protein [Thermoanaerobaculia bacterium]|nr:alkaline phosphatase family protein [Thermoanaerobaculia bacterium]